VDLDEGPDALPYSVQLANALKKNATRVIDLFRSWDTDGDGEVTRKEFHEAMPRLGLDVPKESIDELFDEWDKDGGGAINLNELRRILSQHRAASPTTKTEKAVTATKALSKLSKK
jgi:Ca2+-binding EF-hand superfamily protein